MNTRAAILAVVLLCMPSMVIAKLPGYRCELTIYRTSKSVEIVGQPEDIIRFARCYQYCLTWREEPPHGIEHLAQHGRLILDTKTYLSRSSLNYAIFCYRCKRHPIKVYP